MKRQFIVAVSALMLISLFFGCSSQKSIMAKSDNYIDAIFFEDVSTTETSLAEGAIKGKGEKGSRYVGPYPPLGATHTYSVFVFALKNEPGKFYMGFDGGGNSINDIYKGLNTDAGGNTGNVIAYGHTSGTYTYGG